MSIPINEENRTMTIKQTSLYQQHLACNATMIDFHGWLMPLHYGSQIDEHHAVLTAAGVFDISYLTIIDLHGELCRDFLRYLLANDLAKLKEHGEALYTGMLNASGGVIDDLVVYYFDDDYYRLIANSATRQKDLAWINQHIENYLIDVQRYVMIWHSLLYRAQMHNSKYNLCLMTSRKLRLWICHSSMVNKLMTGLLLL